MKKKKNKAGKKNKSLLNGAAKSLKKLSTTQKVVGGSALALGLGYLAVRQGNLGARLSSVTSLLGNLSFTSTPDVDPNTGGTLPTTEGANI
jgi:hypothetical protein